MRIAERMRLLGTETAFAVAERAAAHAAAGHKVYPFHLGDLNFKTPEYIVEAALRAIRDGRTGYCPNGGLPTLRAALADDFNARRGTKHSLENVSVQPGGKPVIGKFIQTVMNPGDEALYPSPGYPIYESLIEFHGAKARPYGFITGQDGFHIDLDALERAITPRTRLLIVNDFHNPTGASCSPREHEKLAELALRHDLMLLLDEAYFEIQYEGPARSIAGLPGMAERCLVLYTFGKKFAMTGWRLGAAIGPPEVISLITRLNTNIESCTTHFIQYAGLAALQGNTNEAEAMLQALRERRDTAVSLLNSAPGVHCFTPAASFYLYPELSALMGQKGFGSDYAAFAEDVLLKTGVSFCTRLHFGRPLPEEKGLHARLAFSGIDIHEIKEGLEKFRLYAAGA